jgi:hypothetical protein
MGRLSIALCVAVTAAGILAAPVGGGSQVTKPAAKVKQGQANQARLCKRF